MKVIGLIISIIAIVFLILGFIFYSIIFFKKNYKKANNVLNLIFLYEFVCITVLSWSLILMNDGYKIEFWFEDINYYPVLGIDFIFLFYILVTSFITMNKIGRSNNYFVVIARDFKPLLIFLLFSVSSLVFYFNIKYFIFLSSF